jgi:DNA replication protein DnaC
MRERNIARTSRFLERDDFQAWFKRVGCDENSNINEAIDWFVLSEKCKSCEPGAGSFSCDGVALNEYKDGQFITTECENIREHHLIVARQKLDKRLIEANIPSLYMKLSFETYEPANDSQSNALDRCGNVWRGQKGMYLCGQVGIGKTHLAVSILMQNLALFDDCDGYFCRVTELLQKLRPPYNDTELMDKIESVDVLVLDDLGVQKDSEWTYEQITYVLDTRLVNELTTIVTSNLTLEALAKDNLECRRIVSRIKQMCDIVLIRGDDYRDKMARE